MKNRILAAALGVAAITASGAALSGDILTPEWKTMIMQMDKNKDGMISKAEFMAAVEAKWKKMDEKNKGMLSPEDIQRILSSFNP